MSASVGGQYLIGESPRVVNREMVPLAIDCGLANGAGQCEPFAQIAPAKWGTATGCRIQD